MAAAERQHQALAALLELPTRRRSSADAKVMAARLRRASDVSGFALELRRGMRQTAAQRS
jgi:hypothetical protein